MKGGGGAGEVEGKAAAPPDGVAPHPHDDPGAGGSGAAGEAGYHAGAALPAGSPAFLKMVSNMSTSSAGWASDGARVRRLREAVNKRLPDGPERAAALMALDLAVQGDLGEAVEPPELPEGYAVVDDCVFKRHESEVFTVRKGNGSQEPKVWADPDGGMYLHRTRLMRYSVSHRKFPRGLAEQPEPLLAMHELLEWQLCDQCSSLT